MYNRIKSFKLCHFTICGLAVLCCTFLSSFAFAVDMSPNVHPIWTNATSDCSFHVSQNSTTYTQEVFNNTQNFISIDNIYCTFPAGMSSKDTYAVVSFMSDNIDNNDSLDAGFRAVNAQTTSNTNAKYGVVGVEVSRFSNTSSRIDVYLYGEGQNNTSNATIVRLYNPNNSNEIFYLQPRERLSVSGYSFWVADGQTNYSSAIGSISSQIGGLSSGVSSTNSKLDDVNDNLSDLKSSQQQSNDDANARYQDEKDTTYDEANNGKDDMESAFSLPSLLNPLNTWKYYFTENACSVNIPIIASWLHAPSNTYTSWWCSSDTLRGIRSTLTGVLSLAGVIVVFTFAFKWLRTNNGED